MMAAGAALGAAPPRPLVELNPALRGRLAEFAAGRMLVIGYFTSSRCGVVIGDLSTDWRDGVPSSGYAVLPQIEGVPIAIDVRLQHVLAEADAELRPGGMLHAGTPSLWLARPERWLTFLEEGR